MTLKDQMKELFRDMWNVPNVLTILRLLLIPFFVIVYLNGNAHGALAIFCVASFTDCLDGFIARKWHLITSFGKLMDPLADKLMVCSALICMGIKGIFPWDAIILVWIKELLLVSGGTVMLKHGIVVYSNIVGKMATCSFILALILGFLREDIIAMGYRPSERIVLWISVGMALCALINYGMDGIAQLKARKAQEKLASAEQTANDKAE